MFNTDTKALRKLMIDHEIDSIQQMSEMCKISRKTLSEVVNGKKRPTSNVISAIAQTLDLKSEDIAHIFFVEEVT